MHELSLSNGMLEIIRKRAVEDGFDRVLAVRLEIGVLSCVERAALSFCFESVTRGTVAEGARLEILDVAGEAWCWDCEAVVPLARRGEACERCGGYRMKLRDGDNVRIKELEVA
jgi:hydrogenase nickel incorporation protein HypA/HybF